MLTSQQSSCNSCICELPSLGLPAAAGNVNAALSRQFCAQVLKQVYANEENIDDELVQSIALPANDPHASDIFYRVITGWGKPVNELLGDLKVSSCYNKALTDNRPQQCQLCTLG